MNVKATCEDIQHELGTDILEVIDFKTFGHQLMFKFKGVPNWYNPNDFKVV